MFFVCISEECKDQGKQVKNSIPSTKGKEELKLLISHFEDYFWQYTQFTGVPVYICLYNFSVFITLTFLAYIINVNSVVAPMRKIMLLQNNNNLYHINFSFVLHLLKLVDIFSSCYTHTHTHTHTHTRARTWC